MHQIHLLRYFAEVNDALESFVKTHISRLSDAIASVWGQGHGADSVRSAHSDRPDRLDRLLMLPATSHDEQVRHAWNPYDRSPHIFITDDQLTCRRRPVAKSTDCIRGKVAFSRGLHVWQIHWPSQHRGTHAVVGVSTNGAPLQAAGYRSLVGSTEESWGWDLGRNRLCHGNDAHRTYPSWLSSRQLFLVPDTFLVVLDMEEGTLGFVVDGVYLGHAFTGLEGRSLFPIISTVWGNGEVSLTYINHLPPEPLLLQELCRKTIRRQLGRKQTKKMKAINLPVPLKNYLLY